jgi:hypothetical protein
LRAKVIRYRATGCEPRGGVRRTVMGRFLSLFVLPGLLILGACVGVAPKVEGVRTIGIVSAIGDKFYVRKVGLLVFLNESSEMAIDSWGIDDLVTAKIRTALTPRFDVRPVTYRRSVFAAFPDHSNVFHPGLRPELLRTEVAPQGLDAYIVVTKSEAQYSQTNQILQGLGTVRSGDAAPNDAIIFVYAYYGIVLVDGHDFTIKASAIPVIPGQTKLFGNYMRSPYRQFDGTWWPASLDAASNLRLKGVVTELIDQSLPEALQKMQLAQ